MRQQINPSSEKASHAGLATPILMLKRCNAQVKNGGRVELSGKQPLLRFIETDRVAQVFFAKFLLSSAVPQKTVLLRHRFNGESPAFAILDRVARPKANASKRGVVAGILPLLTTGLEFHNDRPGCRLQD